MFSFLSKNCPFGKSYFYVSKLCLILMGYWPESSLTVWRFVLMIVNFTVLLISTICEIWGGVEHLPTEPLRSVDSFCPSASRIVTMWKFLAFYSYRDDLKRVLVSLKDMISKELLLSADRRILAQRKAYIASMFAFTVLCCGMATNTSYTLRPLVADLINYIRGVPVLLNELPFNVKVPRKSMEMPYYLITFSLFSYSGYITVLGFAGVDGFYIGFCLYSSILFKLLQHDVQDALSHAEDTFLLTKADNIKCHLQLLAIIKRHTEVIVLVERFTVLFSSIILIHFVSASLVIAAGMIELLLLSGFESVLYMAHTAATISQLFVYCYGGYCVSDSGQGIADAVSRSQWYRFDVRNQKIALMILMRAQRSTKITVPFFSPSLEAFATMVRTVGSYVALMRTIL